MRRIPFLVKALFALQTIYIVLLFRAGICAWSGISDLGFRLIVTCVSLFVLGNLVVIVTPNVRGLRSCFPIIFLSLYTLLFFYHLRANEPLNYSVVRENLFDLFSAGSFAVVQSRFSGWDWTACVVIYLGSFALEMKKETFSNDVKNKPAWQWRGAYLLGYPAIVFVPIGTFDEVGLFLQSSYKYGVVIPDAALQLSDKEFPYYKVGTTASRKPLPERFDEKRRPHIFLVMIESFNAHFVESKTSDGTSHTPFFNSLIGQGFFVERFYGNSVTTLRGQAATLCSLLPTINGNTVADYPDLNLNGLPRILRKHGYKAVFFHAYEDISFHRTDSFMKQAGFEVMKAMDEEFITEEDRPYIWGWGLQDDRFYRKVFAFLDRNYKQTTSSHSLFITMSTISSHAPFDSIPKKQRALYPNPKSQAENYANTIHAVDAYLREFFSQLESRHYLNDSLVILVGDHGFPMGEHGNYNTEMKCFEENFRTPFLMISKERVRPKRVTSPSYSQLDIAPSILDLLDINEPNHFIGRSMMAPFNQAEIPQLLLQPYNGRFLVAVKYPYKYALHLGDHKEFLFDLRNDPKEQENLLPLHSRDCLPELRKSVNWLFLNQKLVEENRIWSETSLR